MKTYDERLNEGYRVVLLEIFSHLKGGFFKISDEIEPITMHQCLMSPNGLKTQFDPQKLKEFYDSGGILQDLFGFSNNVMQHFFEVSNNFLEGKRYQEAINAFSFLSILNPKVVSFWIGLGLSFEGNQNFEEAIDSFETALIVDPSDFDSYLCLIRCGDSLKDYTKVIELLEALLEDENMKEQAQGALDYIADQKQKI